MIITTYTDAAENTTFHAHCGVAFYAVMFFESGVLAVVKEHQTAEALRSDIWFRDPASGMICNGTI